jgi:hypothetical protein
LELVVVTGVDRLVDLLVGHRQCRFDTIGY